jgi:hypothetical protein
MEGSVMTWPTIREQLRRELTAAKKSRRLMQTDVAARIGKHQSAISKMSGTYQYKRNGPPVGDVVEAVLALGIPVSEFFRRIEQGLPAGELASARLIKPTAGQAIVAHLRGIIRALEGSRPK